MIRHPPAQHRMNPPISQTAADLKPERNSQTHSIRGAARGVRRKLGPRVLESVYPDALAMEWASRDIPAARDLELPVQHMGETLSCSHRAEFVCFGCVVVELKAHQGLTGVNEAQRLNQLRATRPERGLLFNVGRSRLDIKRLVSSNLRKSAQSAN